MNVVALGDHLRANEQVDLAGVKSGQKVFQIVTATHGIAIHAADASAGKNLSQPFLALL